MSQYIPIALPTVGSEELALIEETIRSGWLTQGPFVQRFEADFATHVGAKHAVAVNSCTTGLHVALKCCGVGPGDEVIVPAFTWVATANVVLYCGATPVFVDVKADTYNLDIDQVAARVTAKTKAVIAVHLFGLCADVAALRQRLPAHVRIIEDAACAVGAGLDSKNAGALGDVGVFSFHPRKIITTGEGGMLTTNDEQIARVAGVLRNHGAAIPEEKRHHSPRPFDLPDFDQLGFNYRMTDMQGAMGVAQLRRLPGLLAQRREFADFYINALAKVKWLRPPALTPRFQHGWQAFVCTVDPAKSPLPRNQIMEHLEKEKIASRPGTHAVPMLTFYRKQKYDPNDYPVAKSCHENTLALPLHNRMTLDDCRRVVDVVSKIG